MSRGGDRNMKEKQAKLPGPDGPIAMECNPARVVIAVGCRYPQRRSDVIQLYMRTKDARERDGSANVPIRTAGVNSATCVTERFISLPCPRGTAANRWNTSGSAVSVPRA